MTTIQAVNPWSWQDAQGWSWAMEVKNPTRTLYCAGQVATTPDGRVAHVGDLRAQVDSALDNLETVLRQAGYALKDVVRIDYYTPDPDGLMKAWEVVSRRLLAGGCRAGGVLLGVTRLAHPDLLIEIQAVAAQ